MMRDALRTNLISQWGKELADVMMSKDEKRLEPLVMSVGYFNEERKMLIECPLASMANRTFMLVTASIMIGPQKILQYDGSRIPEPSFGTDEFGGRAVLFRQMFENCRGKKFREIFAERLMLKEVHANPGIKPQYVPIGEDELNKTAMIK
jgi:hypothetical protein